MSFRREKFAPRGGPDGGDGGRGGDVVAVAEPNLDTLLDYRYRLEHHAPDGAPGEASNRTGRGSEDLILPLPPGTRILDDEGELICDLAEAGARFVLARGGRGGFGNRRFRTATRQAPDFAKPGQPAEERWIRLELNVLADVGLVGYPNVGKSTLIRRISAATPRVASYPFTTLQPNLGVVRHHGRDIVVADLPGLIDGAHEGRGLGHRFLRHLSRTRVLVFLLAVDGEQEPPDSLAALRSELEAFEPTLLERRCMVALSRIDLAPDGSELADSAAGWAETLRADGHEVVALSGLAGHGIPSFLDRLFEAVPRREGEGVDRGVEKPFNPIDY